MGDKTAEEPAATPAGLGDPVCQPERSGDVAPARGPIGDTAREPGGVDDGRRDMDRWLGDGGMPLLASLGASLDSYGVDGEELGWVEGSFTPCPLACNPHGVVQAGVHAVLFDACMNFAINAALPTRDRTRGTLELKTETMRAADVGERYALRGEVTRLARQVAFAESSMHDSLGRLVSRATGTFLLARREG